MYISIYIYIYTTKVPPLRYVFSLSGGFVVPYDMFKAYDMFLAPDIYLLIYYYYLYSIIVFRALIYYMSIVIMLLAPGRF